MDERLKLYSKNESSLLDSVKGTIFKAYEKSENFLKMKKIELEKNQRSFKDFEEKIKSKEKEIEEIKEIYKKTLNDLKDEVTMKSRY